MRYEKAENCTLSLYSTISRWVPLGEGSEGVLKMAANTKEFPMMAMSISGALRTQLMMTMGVRIRAVGVFPKQSVFDSFFAIK